MCVLVSVRKRGKKKRRGGRGVCQIRVSGVTATRKSTCTYIYISVCVCVCVCVCACLCERKHPFNLFCQSFLSSYLPSCQLWQGLC